MLSSSSGIRLTIIMLCLTPLGILLLMEACTPMKSALGQSDLPSSLNPSTKDVCAAEFAPATDLHSKATNKADADDATDMIAPFDEKKVHLSGNQFSKASSTLKNQKVIVVLDMTCDSNTADSLSAKVLQQAPGLHTDLKRKALEYTVNEVISPEDFEAAANSDPCVLGVTLPGELRTSTLAAPTTSDPSVAQQQHLGAINYLHAYQNLVAKQTAGSPKVKVGFLDTGVDCSHSDLIANLASGCGFNALNPGTLPTDNDGHGTNTAGLVGAVTNNSQGILGIAGNAVSISAIKVIDVTSGPVQPAYDGIQYAIQNNLDVINISLQSTSQLTLIEQGVSEAVAAGIVVVMAAGNQGQPLVTGVYVSPGAIGRNLKGAITVGSTDVVSNTLSYFSNYGDYVEVAAPGAYDSNLASTVGGLYSTYKGNAYKRMMGTSQASPLIAAAAALVIQFFKANGVAYTPANIEKIVLSSTDAPSNIPISGHRVINFSKLTRNAYAFAGINLCQ